MIDGSRVVVALAVLTGSLACTSQSSETTATDRAAVGGTCVRDADCTDSHAAQQLGRCAPDVVCDHGTCRAECLGICEPASNIEGGGCPAGSLCTASSKPNPDFGAAAVCTKRVLHCTDVAQCPSANPGPGAWSCLDGTCRFPGLTYPFE